MAQDCDLVHVRFIVSPVSSLILSPFLSRDRVRLFSFHSSFIYSLMHASVLLTSKPCSLVLTLARVPSVPSIMCMDYSGLLLSAVSSDPRTQHEHHVNVTERRLSLSERASCLTRMSHDLTDISHSNTCTHISMSATILE